MRNGSEVLGRPECQATARKTVSIVAASASKCDGFRNEKHETTHSVGDRCCLVRTPAARECQVVRSRCLDVSWFGWRCDGEGFIFPAGSIRIMRLIIALALCALAYAGPDLATELAELKQANNALEKRVGLLEAHIMNSTLRMLEVFPSVCSLFLLLVQVHLGCNAHKSFSAVTAEHAEGRRGRRSITTQYYTTAQACTCVGRPGAPGKFLLPASWHAPALPGSTALLLLCLCMFLVPFLCPAVSFSGFLSWISS